MTQLVIDGRKSADHWTHLEDDEAPDGTGFTVNVDRWHEQRGDIIAHAERAGCSLGVRVAIGVDLMRLARDIDRFALIVIRIRNASDGRFFSIAAQLREHLGYRGEVRVTGDVAPDQLAFMRRCGVNAFELEEDVDVEHFIYRYRRFYQSSGSSTNADNLIRLARRRRPQPAGQCGFDVQDLPSGTETRLEAV